MSLAWRRRVVLALATGFGAGYVPKAPGTAGSLVGVGIGVAIAPLDAPVAIAITVAVCAAGFPICAAAERMLRESDPSIVVWDEIAGMLLAGLALPAGWLWWLAAFGLFRAFDVVKPWPIGWMDRRLTGGTGIMADDLAAGALAWVAIQAVGFLVGGEGLPPGLPDPSGPSGSG